MDQPVSISILSLLGTGFLLGWSVAWPPGPVNAETARRCLAGGFWHGFALVLGSCFGDGLWAVLVSLGIGFLFAGPIMRDAMGAVSVALLLILCFMFLKNAATAYRATHPAPQAPPQLNPHRTGFMLGAFMALTSPWNVAFWLAAMGRPELIGYPARALLILAAAVIAGAATWGVLFSGAVVLLHRQSGGSSRWWTVIVNLATAIMMAVFAAQSAKRLLESGLMAG